MHSRTLRARSRGNVLRRAFATGGVVALLMSLLVIVGAGTAQAAGTPAAGGAKTATASMTWGSDCYSKAVVSRTKSGKVKLTGGGHDKWGGKDKWGKDHDKKWDWKDWDWDKKKKDCPPPKKPDPIVKEVPSTAVDCATEKVVTTITRTTIDWVLVGKKWVQTAPVVTTRTESRPATKAELNQANCPPPSKPDPIRSAVPSERVDCTSQEVITTTRFTTIDWSYDAASRTWVKQAPVVEERITGRRPATAAELNQANCPPPTKPRREVTVERSSRVDCTSKNVVTTTITTTVEYVYNSTTRTWVKGTPVVTRDTASRPATDAELDAAGCEQPEERRPIVRYDVVETVDCTADVVTTKTTRTTRTWSQVNGTWVLGDPVTVVVDTSTRKPTQAECPDEVAGVETEAPTPSPVAPPTTSSPTPIAPVVVAPTPTQSVVVPEAVPTSVAAGVDSEAAPSRAVEAITRSMVGPLLVGAGLLVILVAVHLRRRGRGVHEV